MKPRTALFYHQEFEPTCPFCQTTLNGIASNHEDMPRSGDFSVCIHCGEILVFQVVAGEIGLRKPKPRETKEAACEPEVRQLRLNWLSLHGQHGNA